MRLPCEMYSTSTTAHAWQLLPVHPGPLNVPLPSCRALKILYLVTRKATAGATQVSEERYSIVAVCIFITWFCRRCPSACSRGSSLPGVDFPLLSLHTSATPIQWRHQDDVDPCTVQSGVFENVESHMCDAFPESFAARAPAW